MEAWPHEIGGGDAANCSFSSEPDESTAALIFSLKMINLTRTDDVGISEMTKLMQRCSLCVTFKINQIFDLKQVFSSIC